MRCCKRPSAANSTRLAREAIRKQVLAGDFSWMPVIKVVDQAALQDVSGTQGEGVSLGAYSAETNTV